MLSPELVNDISIRSVTIPRIDSFLPLDAENLATLELRSTSTTSLAGIENFRNLKTLTVTDSPYLSSVPVLPPAITRLDISGTGVEDLSSLSGRGDITIVAKNMASINFVCPTGVKSCER